MLDPEQRRVVVKLGTNTLCDPDGLPDTQLLASLAEEIHLLRAEGHQVLVVSSGAIGSGRAVLKLPETPRDVAMRQACAAVGQHKLMQAWDNALRRHKVPAAQILVTADTFEVRRRYLNLRNCLEALLKQGAVPIINENDTTSIDEIDAAFTDNDRLGALVAAKVEADLYVILSDVPGLYDKPPHLKTARLVPRVEAVTEKVLKMAGARNGREARGGMRSKLESAKHLTESGVPVVIAYGREPGILHKLLHPEPDPTAEGEEPGRPGTWFDTVGRRDGRERWIAAATPQGRIVVDAGAARALREGFHLLPAGVRGVEGQFPVESVVEIVHDGRKVARAVSQFSSLDLQRCLGMQSDGVRETLGVEGSVNVTRKGRIILDGE